MQFIRNLYYDLRILRAMRGAPEPWNVSFFLQPKHPYFSTLNCRCVWSPEGPAPMTATRGWVLACLDFSNAF